MAFRTTKFLKRSLPGFALLAFLGLIAILIYAGSVKVQYPWAWKQIPSYFLNHSKEIVTAPESATITALHQEKEDTLLELTTPAGFETTLRVSDLSEHLHEGTIVNEGDPLGRSYRFQAGPLLLGLWNTVWISALCCTVGFLLGILFAFVRTRPVPGLDLCVGSLIEVIRGTPLLVQLFIAYFVIGSLFSVSNIAAGLFSFALFASCFYAEIIRGALISLSKGQQEAAFSLGLNCLQTYRYVLLPQALRNALPALIGQSISLIKDSSLLSVIAITDLTKSGREVIASSFATFEVWTVVALLYLILTLIISGFGRLLQKRWRHA